MRLDDFEVLTFDCYGTLIDWEAGILTALRPLFTRHEISATDDEVLELYARIELSVERGPYRRYREVLSEVTAELGREMGFEPSADEAGLLGESLGDWPPFDDTVESLEKLGRRYKLGILSNIDDDLFALSHRHLGAHFEWIVTAQQAGAYKPSKRVFDVARERIGAPTERILHVAQSLFHDIAPAREVGLSTVWVNRRHGRRGSGATPPAEVRPDLEVQSLVELVELVAAEEAHTS